MNGPYASFLLTKLRYIGDVLLTTPAIRAIREAYPSAHITMLVNRGTEDVLRHNARLDRVVTVERGTTDRLAALRREWELVRRLRQVRYDVSVDFFSGDRAAFLSLACGVPLRIGFAGREGFRRWVLNRQADIQGPIHMLERNLLLLQQTLGLEPGDTRPELQTGPDDEDYADGWLQRRGLGDAGFVAIHPGGRAWFKRWPAERWAALIDLLQAEGHPVILTGGPAEEADLRRIAAAAATPIPSAAGQTSILQLAALLRRARLFIGNDSGPMHLAAAVGTPVVALFGPTEPELWRPWGEGHVVISRHAECGRGCASGDCREAETCMGRIPVEEVAAAARAVLAAPRASGFLPHTPSRLMP
jgi:predicted lipopolysaccharide heptosyltransferase III